MKFIYYFYSMSINCDACLHPVFISCVDTCAFYFHCIQELSIFLTVFTNYNNIVTTTDAMQPKSIISMYQTD